MINSMNNTGTFLKSLEKLSDAFFVHVEHQQYQLNALTGATEIA